ncbi:hypothetical protein O77CONTIG1_04190 [Leptolyngbya sp. O-77]|nr:hypothetical protein O77CONTIG1_04190 [Leptolyngbya sp. O-77]
MSIGHSKGILKGDRPLAQNWTFALLFGHYILSVYH